MATASENTHQSLEVVRMSLGLKRRGGGAWVRVETLTDTVESTQYPTRK